MSDAPRTPEQVAAALAALPEAAGARLRQALALAGEDHNAAVVARFSSRLGGSDTLRSRSRQLVGSLGYRVAGDALADLQLSSFSAGVPYARLQEYGGDVAPKNVKNLTIPQQAALTPAGVARFTARELLERRKDAFFLKDKRGRVWLVAPKHPTTTERKRAGPGRPGPNARLTDKNLRRPKTLQDLRKQTARSPDLEFYFLLVPHAVYVPPRLHFFQSWRELAPRRAALLGKALSAAVADAAGGAA